jgi:Ca2+-transporting ATPase
VRDKVVSGPLRVVPAFAGEPDGWHTLTPPEAAGLLDVDIRIGLSSEEARGRGAQEGGNRLDAPHREPLGRAVVRRAARVEVAAVVAAGILELHPGDRPGAGAALLAAAALAAGLGLWRDGRAAGLEGPVGRLLPETARVRRDGRVMRIPAAQVVLGDVVLLEAGDVVPADGRLLRAASLTVDEALVTGAALPAAKATDPVFGADAALDELTDMVFLGSTVVSGSGAFVATATGPATQLGAVTRLLEAPGGAPTPLARALRPPLRALQALAVAALLLATVLQLVRGSGAETTLAVLAALAVAAVPTGLAPSAGVLAWAGRRALARAGAQVRRPRALEALGAVSAVVVDARVLTLHELTAVELVIPGQRLRASGRGYGGRGVIKRAAGRPAVSLEPFLLPLVLSTAAVVDEGRLVGDPLDAALVVLAEKGGVDAELTREAFPRVAEVPHDEDHKLDATFHRMLGEDGHAVIRGFVKGGPEQLLARAGARLDHAGRRVPVDGAFRARFRAEAERMTEHGLRVVATARVDVEAQEFDTYDDPVLALHDLTLLGLVGVVDPPHRTVGAAVATAREAGLAVRLVGGERRTVMEAMAGRLGIGEELGVVASATAEDRLRLVADLRRDGEVVAVAGGGVADAPALAHADAGLAVGRDAGELAGAVAAAVVPEPSLLTAMRAITQSRPTYSALLRSARYHVATATGLVALIVLAGIFDVLGGRPLTALQVLWLGAVVHVVLSLGLGPGPHAGTRPWWVRPVLPVVVQAAATLAVIAWAVDDTDAVTRTVAMTAFALGSVALAWALSDEARPVLGRERRRDARLLRVSAVALILTVLASHVRPLGRCLGTQELTAVQWLAAAAVPAAVVVAAEAARVLARRRAGG